MGNDPGYGLISALIGSKNDIKVKRRTWRVAQSGLYVRYYRNRPSEGCKDLRRAVQMNVGNIEESFSGDISSSVSYETSHQKCCLIAGSS